MQVVQTKNFARAIKKLHPNQKLDLDEAVKTIIANPNCGEAKVGDLAGYYVYKFKMANQLTLLAYSINMVGGVLTLTLIGSHENFYRELKKSIY